MLFNCSCVCNRWKKNIVRNKMCVNCQQCLSEYKTKTKNRTEYLMRIVYDSDIQIAQTFNAQSHIIKWSFACWTHIFVSHYLSVVSRLLVSVFSHFNGVAMLVASHKLCCIQINMFFFVCANAMVVPENNHTRFKHAHKPHTRSIYKI